MSCQYSSWKEQDRFGASRASFWEPCCQAALSARWDIPPQPCSRRHLTNLRPRRSFKTADASLVFPQRIIVSEVKNDEIEAAINTFVGAQRKIRKDVASGKYRLLWLTAWDWDTAKETGDTISILSDGYRRYVTLNSRRTRIAIPEPRSGYIEMRGEVAEGGNISISLLSGTQPIALPSMPPGQAIRIQIDNLVTRRVVSALLNICLTNEAPPFQPFGFDIGSKF